MLTPTASGSLVVRGALVLALVLALLALAGCHDASVGQAASAPARSPVLAQPAAPAQPDGAEEVDRERIGREATWAPGQLRAHVSKHGHEGPWAYDGEYDASARETIRIGTAFTYTDRESNAERLGFYHRDSNRFTGVTRDGRRITTHFRPGRGAAYVRGLNRSTYR